ncbi:MAG: TPM domain-containing protein [Rubrivivax sp.]
MLLVPSDGTPEDIAAYAQRVADQWKIGRRDRGDGLLLVVAKNDRRVRIEVAKALEGAVPDLAARQIIDNAIPSRLPRRRLRRRPERRARR